MKMSTLRLEIEFTPRKKGETYHDWAKRLVNRIEKGWAFRGGNYTHEWYLEQIEVTASIIEAMFEPRT